MAGEQLVPWWYPGLAIGMIDYVTNKYLPDEEDTMPESRYPGIANEPGLAGAMPERELSSELLAAIEKFGMASRMLGVSAERYADKHSGIPENKKLVGEATTALYAAISAALDESKSVEVFYAIRPEDKDWHCYSCGEPIIVGDDFVLGPREGVEGLNYFHGGCWEDYDANK